MSLQGGDQVSGLALGLLVRRHAWQWPDVTGTPLYFRTFSLPAIQRAVICDSQDGREELRFGTASLPELPLGCRLNRGAD